VVYYKIYKDTDSGVNVGIYEFGIIVVKPIDYVPVPKQAGFVYVKQYSVDGVYELISFV
jgi:hypothetical protein